MDGKRLLHHYFCDHHDIAPALCTDSYLLYKSNWGKPIVTPVILQNYNIPPTRHTHHEHLICVGIIPSPRQPKELSSFLSPLDDELAKLAYGVLTFDADKRVLFDLHVYIIFKLGDILAIQKFLEIKGHNSIFPCQLCKIKAVYGLGKTHYTMLQPPKNTPNPLIWDPEHLPMHTHHDFISTFQNISEAPSKAARGRIMKKTGICGLPGLCRVASLDYACSAPWEWFHLLLENVIPNLINLWTGQFKGLESNTDEFMIAAKVWEEIAQEMMAAVQHIPIAFIQVLGNIAMNCSQFTADLWCFWFLYVASILLENWFLNQKYYAHVCELSVLMKLMLQFHMTEEEVGDIEVWLQKWVQKYEKLVFCFFPSMPSATAILINSSLFARYYYQYCIECLPACTLTIHNLLHVAEGIHYCGPAWTMWSFFMERYHGTLQWSMQSHASHGATWTTLYCTPSYSSSFLCTMMFCWTCFVGWLWRWWTNSIWTCIWGM